MKLIASTITKPNGKGGISADIIPPARSSRHMQPGHAGTVPPRFPVTPGKSVVWVTPCQREGKLSGSQNYLMPAFVSAADAEAAQGGLI